MTDGPFLDRRDLLRMTAGAAAMTCSGSFGAIAHGTDGTSLRDLGSRKGISYGLCESSAQYGHNREYFEKLSIECSLFSPGNDFNWRAIEKKKALYAFGSLDVMANYCRSHQLGMIGHTLAWYYTVPEWAKALEADAFKLAFEGYLAATMERFSDVVVRWDVVNEAVDPKSDRPDGLRKSDFLLKLGPAYIADAFVAARKAAPRAPLCLNEYGIEALTAESARKRDSFLNLIRDLNRQKVPIDIIGLQSHLNGWEPIDVAGLSAFLREVKSLGYRVAITELDVNDVKLPADIAQRDQLVADHVDRYLSCVFSEMKPTAIVNWGFSDPRSWLTTLYKRADGLPLRPLAFDAELRRKPMWSVIRRHIAGE